MSDAMMIASIETNGTVDELVRAAKALQDHREANPTTYVEDDAGNLLQRVSLWREGHHAYLTFD